MLLLGRTSNIKDQYKKEAEPPSFLQNWLSQQAHAFRETVSVLMAVGTASSTTSGDLDTSTRGVANTGRPIELDTNMDDSTHFVQERQNKRNDRWTDIGTGKKKKKIQNA